IISTVAYYNEYASNQNDLFGTTFNGEIYIFNNGWNLLANSGINNVMGITIGYSPDLKPQNTYFRNGYTLFILTLNNNTKVYEYNHK
ncbi:MAG: hypothetical protein QXY47_04430, partial [Thermoplasmata archaeon]